MEKEIKLVIKEVCTGCRACSNACPADSISFVLMGLHYYPVINSDTCIKCGKCMQVCTPLNWNSKHGTGVLFEPTYYCAWNEDRNERFQSTSGGVGGALAKHALEIGWHVCGAAFDENWQLHHITSNDKSIIEKIRGSKYLQSNTEGVYKQILQLLKEGEKVLFIGTPCQTDALHNSIPLKYIDQFLLCEIICHGVNSPVVWSDYNNYIEKKSGSPLKRYNFRSKSKGWGKLRASYCFENGKKKDEPGWKNIFHSWFGLHYIMRESCFRCQYRTKKRYSDIIIGDFWGIENIEPQLNVRAGASVLIENSEKAVMFLKDVQIHLHKLETERTLSVLKGFTDKMPEKVKKFQIARMKQFEVDYKIHTFEEMALKLYPHITFFDKYVKSILYFLHILK